MKLYIIWEDDDLSGGVQSIRSTREGAELEFKERRCDQSKYYRIREYILDDGWVD